MICYIGIDIGSVSATAAILIKGDNRRLQTSNGTFHRLESLSDGEKEIYISSYRRTRGRPLEAAGELLEEIIAAVGSEQIKGISLTGSGAKAVASNLAATVVNEFKAIAAGLGAMKMPISTVFEIGGESSKYLRLHRNDNGSFGIVDYATNGDCAAGTGSFLDQQAGRLRYTVEQIGPLVSKAKRAAQIAGRCSVFAKSDMIHAQQKGYTPPEVLGGLCDAVARNFRTAVVRSHPVNPPVAFIGGVAANSAVVRAIRESFDLNADQLIIPEAFGHVPAIGSAVIASQTAIAADLSGINDFRAASDTAHGVFPTTAPLSMDRVVLLRDRIEPYELPYGNEKIDAYLGIDVGSVSTNLVVIDEEGRVVHEIYTRTQGRPIEVVAEGLSEIHSKLANRLNIRGTGATGSGRELIGKLVGADTINDEITAHTTGATVVGSRMLGGANPRYDLRDRRPGLQVYISAGRCCGRFYDERCLRRRNWQLPGRTLRRIGRRHQERVRITGTVEQETDSSWRALHRLYGARRQQLHSTRLRESGSCRRTCLLSGS